jgi:hypothetical protein
MIGVSSIGKRRKYRLFIPAMDCRLPVWVKENRSTSVRAVIESRLRNMNALSEDFFNELTSDTAAK